MKRIVLINLILCMCCLTADVLKAGDHNVYWLILCLVNAACAGVLFALDNYK